MGSIPIGLACFSHFDRIQQISLQLGGPRLSIQVGHWCICFCNSWTYLFRLGWLLLPRSLSVKEGVRVCLLRVVAVVIKRKAKKDLSVFSASPPISQGGWSA